MILRHTGIIIALSLVILILSHTLYTCLQGLYTSYQWISSQLSAVFTSGSIGNMIRHLIAILLVPALAGGIPAGIYWMKKRRQMPFAAHIIWVSWIIQAVTVVIFSSQVIALAGSGS